MPTWTTVPLWAVGQKIKAAVQNLSVTAIGELQTWGSSADSRIGGLETSLGVFTKRPQLRVYAPASVTNGSVVPYASTRKDTHGPYGTTGSGWDSTNYRWYCPTSGLYLVQFACKAGGVAAHPAQNFRINGTGQIWMGAPPSASYIGQFVAGVLDIPSGAYCDVVENYDTYTPQNDGAGSYGLGSNFLAITYLGPTT